MQRVSRFVLFWLAALGCCVGISLSGVDSSGEDTMGRRTSLIETPNGRLQVDVRATSDPATGLTTFRYTVNNVSYPCGVTSFGIVRAGCAGTQATSPQGWVMSEELEFLIWDGPPTSGIRAGTSEEFVLRTTQPCSTEEVAGYVWIHSSSACGRQKYEFRTLGPHRPTTNDRPSVNLTTHGEMTQNETWTGTIRIVGDVFVPYGVTLTIEPGTRVLIAANQDAANLQLDPWLMKRGVNQGESPEDLGVHVGEPYWDESHHVSITVAGDLHAVGTAEQMITITSDSAEPKAGDWNMLSFAHGTLAYCTVEYGRGVTFGDGTISHCILRHVIGCAACRSPGVIEESWLYDATHELIGVAGYATTIRGNRIGPTAPHGGTGICVIGGAPKIIDNVFDHCRIAVVFIGPRASELVMKGNTFVGCQQEVFNE